MVEQPKIDQCRAPDERTEFHESFLSDKSCSQIHINGLGVVNYSKPVKMVQAFVTADVTQRFANLVIHQSCHNETEEPIEAFVEFSKGSQAKTFTKVEVQFTFPDGETQRSEIQIEDGN